MVVLRENSLWAVSYHIAYLIGDDACGSKGCPDEWAGWTRTHDHVPMRLMGWSRPRAQSRGRAYAPPHIHPDHQTDNETVNCLELNVRQQRLRYHRARCFRSFVTDTMIGQHRNGAWRYCPTCCTAHHSGKTIECMISARCTRRDGRGGAILDDPVLRVCLTTRWATT